MTQTPDKRPDSQPLQHNPDAAIEFLRLVRPAGPWNLSAIVPDVPGIKSTTLRDADEVCGWIDARPDSNIYYVLNDAPVATGDRGRVLKADVERVAGHGVDIDVDKQLEGRTLETAKVERLAKLKAHSVPGPPSLIVDSGGGLQPIWLYKEAVPVDRLPDAEKINIALIEQCDGDTGTHDLGRLLRLPGTVNWPDAKKRKRGRMPALAALVHQVPRRYHVTDDFQKAAVMVQAATVEAAIRIGPAEESDLPTLAIDYGLSDDLLTIIRAGRLPKEKPGDDTRSAWVFDATMQLVGKGVPDEVVLWILTNTDFSISESINDNPRGGEAQAVRLIRQVHGRRLAEAVADFADESIESEWLESHAKKRSRFRRFSLTELLAFPPSRYLVTPFIPEGGLVQIYGPRKTGKTFLALDLALCVATGRAFHGQPVEQGRVIYIIGEGGSRRFADRMLAWCRNHKVDPYDLKDRFDVMPHRMGVDNPTDLKAFLAEDGDQAALVVVDTLARNMDGDENATADMNRMVKGLDAIREHHQGAVLVVHHSGKEASRQGRGSTVLPSAVDATLKVSKDANRTVLELEESRNDEAGMTLTFEGVSVVIGDLESSSLVMRLVDAGMAQTVTAKTGAEKVLVAIAEEGQINTQGDLVDDDRGLSKSTVSRAINELKDGGLVEGDGPWFTTAKGNEKALKLGAVLPGDDD